MADWWNGLETVTQVFYGGAAFFSLLFLWQFISALIGLAGDGGDMDFDADMDVDMDGLDLGDIEDAGGAMSSFQVLSLRAILAFLMLFCWAAAMYTDNGLKVSQSLLFATGWGLAAWALVTIMVHYIRKLAETGNARIASCVGTAGTVYLDIPATGMGEIRVLVSGVVTRVRARGKGGVALPSGTPIRVVRKIDPTTVEVETVENGTTEGSNT